MEEKSENKNTEEYEKSDLKEGKLDNEVNRTTREKITRLIADSFLPEIIRKGIESATVALLNPEKGLKKVLPDIKIRREMADYLIKQVEETKNLALRVIASEIRSFLEHTDLENAIRNVLTSLAFEVTTVVRFKTIDKGGVIPEVKTRVVKIKNNSSIKNRKKKNKDTT